MINQPTTPAQPGEECLLQHRLEGSTTATRSCTAPATHAWHRPGKTPIPCCSKGIRPGRDVRKLGIEDHPAFAAFSPEIRAEIARTAR